MCRCAAGKFSGNVADVLQRVIVDFISNGHKPGCSISGICETVRSTQPLAIATPASVSQSVVIRGLLLDRGVATRDMQTRITESAHIHTSTAHCCGNVVADESRTIVVLSRSVRLLLLTCSLSPEVASATITVRNQDEYHRLLQSGEQSVRSLLLRIRERGANVLLSTVAQHQSTLQMCAQLSITVVQLLSDAEVQRVCLYTGAVCVSSPHEIDTASLGRASAMRLVQLGNRVCVQLDVEDSVHEQYKPHTLVLAAASAGIAKQYQQAVMRAFTLLAQFASLFTASSTSLFVLPGAGATEAELSLRCSSRYSPTVLSSVGWRVMAAALLAVPHALYDAACSEDDVSYARFMEIRAIIRAQARSQWSPMGIGQSIASYQAIGCPVLLEGSC